MSGTLEHKVWFRDSFAADSVFSLIKPSAVSVKTLWARVALPNLENGCILFKLLISVTSMLHVSLNMVLRMKYLCMVSIQALHVIHNKERQLVACFPWFSFAAPSMIRMSIIMRDEVSKNPLDILLVVLQFTRSQWSIFDPVTNGNGSWILCNQRVAPLLLRVYNFRLLLNCKEKGVKQRGMVASKRLWATGSRFSDLQGIIKTECAGSMEHPHSFSKWESQVGITEEWKVSGLKAIYEKYNININ